MEPALYQVFQWRNEMGYSHPLILVYTGKGEIVKAINTAGLRNPLWMKTSEAKGLTRLPDVNVSTEELENLRNQAPLIELG